MNINDAWKQRAAKVIKGQERHGKLVHGPPESNLLSGSDMTITQFELTFNAYFYDSRNFDIKECKMNWQQMDFVAWNINIM